MSAWPARAGAPGAVAVLALSAALPLAAWWTPLWRDEARAASAAGHAVGADRAPRPATATLPAPDPATAQPVLPEAGGDPSERVAALLRLAARHGVSIDAVAQRSERTAAVPSLQIDLTVSGRYADIRAMLAAALAADPALALDRLLLRRAGSDAGPLQAELRWTLLHQRGATT